MIPLDLRVVARLKDSWITHPGFIASCLALAVLLPAVHFGFYIQDESFLWYGAQRVLAGEVPLRDFASYDPGRYYWSAAVMSLLHSHGLVAMRIAAIAALVIGLWIAASLVFRDRKRLQLLSLFMVAATFIVWLPSLHKFYEVTASIVLVALLAWLVAEPTRLRCFTSGVAIGLIAILGRNHGLYGAVADVIALLVVTLVEKRAALVPSFLYWGAGVVIGYSPMLLAMALLPEFWVRFWEGIEMLYKTGTTNTPDPLPWPWRVSFADPPLAVARNLLIGCFLMALPIYGAAVAAYSLWRAAARKIPIDPVIFSAALLAIVYTHHTATRMHLSQAIYPMLIGAFAWIAMSKLSAPKALTISGVICAMSVFAMLPAQDYYISWTERDTVRMKIGDDMLDVNPYVAKGVDVLEQLVAKYAPGSRPFAAVPYSPGAYALFDRRAPLWQTYALFPADTALQQAEIARLQAAHPGFILLETDAIDGNPALTFSNTNPLVYRYIMEHFDRYRDPAIPSYWSLQLYLPQAAAR